MKKHGLPTKDRLQDVILTLLRRAESDEFFVQKAIGWILREYAKTHQESVKLFVSQHQLKHLSKQEALKYLS
jgi:3-methyladenine DNA glycosylase AlkD